MPKRERRFHPMQGATDLTDAQWVTSAPFVTAASPKSGRLTDIDRRAVVNALRSKQRTGCQWRRLLADVSPMSSVRSSCDPWSRDGTFVKYMIRRVTWHDRRWIATRRHQSASWTPNQPQRLKRAASAASTKKVNGRKQQFWVDTNGFL